MATTPREADERALRMLALRDRGLTNAEIADRLDVPSGTVGGVLWRIDNQLASSEGRLRIAASVAT